MGDDNGNGIGIAIGAIGTLCILWLIEHIHIVL